MIDTGSSKTLISPKLVELFYCDNVYNEPFAIQSAHNISCHDYVANIMLPSVFKVPIEHKFYIFEFHPEFDGLIGTDLLSKLEANIDFKTKCLNTKNATIPIHCEKMCNKTNSPLSTTTHKVNAQHCYQMTLQGRTNTVVKVPVNVSTGVGILHYNKFPCGVEIPNAIVEAKNNYVITTAINPNDYKVTVKFPKPLQMETFNINELNNYESMDLDDIDENTLDEMQRQNLNKLRLEHMNEEEKNSIWKLCVEFRDIFYNEKSKLSFSNTVKHKLYMKDDTPVYTKCYRQAPIQKQEIAKQVQSLLQQGIIEPSSSAWSCPVHIVPKKMDASGRQKWRMVIDYRRLNEKTLDDKYPLPNISDILDKLGRSQMFTTLDLASGYHQVEMDAEDVAKTAFSTEQGHYHFLRMPFGLKNAPSTFQRVMDNVLRGVQNESCLVYLDDIIVYSVSLQEHIERLREIFKRLRTANLKVQLDKSEFLRKEVAYLGHVITPQGVKPNPDKIKAIKSYPIPKTTSEIKAFLGLLGYYRRFIKDFANLTKPLTKCLKKGVKIILTPEYQECFERCKSLLTNNPILKYPDFTMPFNLTTDASNVALGAILSQGEIGKDTPIAYASRTLSETECKYDTTEKEWLAVVWAVKHFRPYLYGQKFKVYTDHQALKWLFNLKDPNSKLARWRLRLLEYDFEIFHRPGKQNANADALSRIHLNALETDSMIVNPDEELDKLLKDFEYELSQLDQQDTNNQNETEPQIQISIPSPDDLSPIDDDLETIHSTLTEEPNNSIKILHEAIDSKPNQILINEILTEDLRTKIEKRKHQTIMHVQLPKHDRENKIIQLFKEYVTDARTYYIYCSDEIYKVMCEIYIKIFNNKGPKIVRCTDKLIVIINPEEQLEMIKNYHESHTNHRGITETLKQMQRRYYWTDMKNTISAYINKCAICQKSKYERNPPEIPMMLTETYSRPFQRLHADTFTIGGRYFLTIVDAFSKLGQAIQISSKNATEIAQAFVEYFRMYGICEAITLDNGTEFNNEIVKQLLKLHKINPHFITAHNPESNGIVERFHGTLIEQVRTLQHKHRDPIELLVKYAIIAYNSTIHTTTNKTPNELIFGHTNINNPFDIDYSHRVYDEYIQTHKDRMREMYDTVHDKVLKEKTKLIEKRNENRNGSNIFCIGQQVYEKIRSNNRNKLTDKYKGPFELIKINNDYTAEVKNGNKIRRIAIRNLRHPSVSDGAPEPSSPTSSPRSKTIRDYFQLDLDRHKT